MKKLMKFGAAVAAGVVASTSFAQAATGGPDFSSLTGAISLDTVSTAVMAVGVMIIGVIMAIAGVKTVIRMVRGV
jgi:hypothetical protein